MLFQSRVNIAVRGALYAAAVISSGSVYAADEDASKDEAKEIERVEVVGSRINRVDMEGPAPVVVISAEDLSDRGFNTAFDALKALSQNTGNVQGNEFGSQGGFTPNADVLSLRGFGPGYTLVLINGRRLAENPTPYNGQSNFVNLSSIPFAAIDRIEVLTSGASAIYGSDAVAGVVDIKLKKDVEQTTIGYKYGTTKDGGGDSHQLSAVTGLTGSDHSLTAAFEYYKQDPIFGKDRDWLDSVDDGPDGVDYLTRGILLLDRWNGGYVDPGEQKCLDSGSGYEYAFREGSGNYCGYDATGEYAIQNERERASAYITGSYDLTDNISLFSDIMYTDIQSYTRGFRHFISEDVIIPQTDGSGNLLPDLGVDADYVLIQRIFDFGELGERSTDFDEQVFAGVIGIEGSFGDSYQWSAYYNESRYDYESSRNWIKEEKANEYFIGEGTAYFGFPDGLGAIGLYDPITPEIAADMLGTQVIKADSYSRTIAAEITGDLLDLPAGPIQFAATAEFNKQGYDLNQDDRTLNNDGMGWYGLTGTVGDGDRDRYAAGAEFLIPILDELELELAGRYDEYDDSTTDVGGRFTPSVKLTYRPFEQLMLRANWGESFRAPDMHYVFAGDSGFFTNVYDYTQCAADWDPADGQFTPVPANCDTTNIQGTRSGSLTLEEEKGTNYGYGFVFEPIENLSLTLDYYSVELEDLIGDQSIQDLLDDEYDCNNNLGGKDGSSAECQQVYSQITRSTSDVTNGDLESVDISPINRAKLRQQGVDASIDYSFDTAYGEWGMVGTWTHILSTKYQATDQDSFDEIRDDADNTEPRSKIQATVTWQYEDWAAAVTALRIGSIPKNIQPLENYDEDGELVKIDRLGSHTTFNATVGYSFSDNLAATFTAVNVFDRQPPVDDSETSWPYYNVFAYPGGAIGAQYYAEVSYSF